MKNLIVATLCLVAGPYAIFSQSTIGRQNVDQYRISSGGSLTYGLTWLPADYNSTSTKYPLIIFLHGAGDVGTGVNGLNKLLNRGIPKKISEGWNADAVNPADGESYKF